MWDLTTADEDGYRFLKYTFPKYYADLGAPMMFGIVEANSLVDAIYLVNDRTDKTFPEIREWLVEMVREENNEAE